MRLRSSRGVRKRYVDEPIIFDDDDEPIAVPDSNSKDDDFEAHSDGAQAQDGDDEEQEEPEEPEGEPTSDEAAALNDEEAVELQEQSPQPRRHKNIGAGVIQGRRGFHDIPNYPLEPRIATRVYAGPLRRYARYRALRGAMYGPEYERVKLIWDLELRWAGFPVLPPALPPQHAHGVAPSPWLPRGFEADQAQRAFHWYDAKQINASDVQRSRMLPLEHGRQYVPQAGGNIVTLIGPWDKQKELTFTQGGSLCLCPSGLPLDDPNISDKTPSGWMFDVGGIPLAVAWAPLARQDCQLLAVAAIPFADQELRQPGGPETDAAAEATGCIQLWEFAGDRADGRLATPARRIPRLLRVRCFDWGRPKRIQFCPVPPDSSVTYGMLAILCGDGIARVIDVNIVVDTDGPSYELLESPVATLGLSDDYNVQVSCLTWVNTNRIALGHTDGSITLWSIYPQQLLQRVGAHTTYVIDICSAYPSNPYLVASIPVGGCVTLTDLSQPSSELTYVPVPSISFQPNLLCWNETMQGFMALYPATTPTTTIAFIHHRYFCQARSISTGSNTVTCVSAGATHPFVLVGCADGSVSSCNALRKLFKQKGELPAKLKIFEHEYRPLDPESQTEGAPKLRGAARILQGFLPESNDDPRTEKRKEVERKKRANRKHKKVSKKKRWSGMDSGSDDVDEADEDLEAELDEKLASRLVIHEPLTRVTAVAWNPNLQFSAWAACALGSGLIRVMDLGVQ